MILIKSKPLSEERVILVIMILTILSFFAAASDYRTNLLFAEQGIPIQATVEKLSNASTKGHSICEITYSYIVNAKYISQDTDSGKCYREIGSKVTVLYLPYAPNTSRLPNTKFPYEFFLCIAGILASCIITGQIGGKHKVINEKVLGIGVSIAVLEQVLAVYAPKVAYNIGFKLSNFSNVSHMAFMLSPFIILGTVVFFMNRNKNL